jgi:hypothetical protein
LQVPGFDVLYRNQPVVAAPFGFAEPFRVAVAAATDVAACDVVAGASAPVVNESTDPKLVPMLLLDIAQK